mmetsp:Transcript_101528/g.293850  ORF Transcript_101528/g.293850 Transcript_101528/m.293850 type:complete len:252 (+) Transcript_101528:1771-2526(+)
MVPKQRLRGLIRKGFTDAFLQRRHVNLKVHQHLAVAFEHLLGPSNLCLSGHSVRERGHRERLQACEDLLAMRVDLGQPNPRSRTRRKVAENASNLDLAAAERHFQRRIAIGVFPLQRVVVLDAALLYVLEDGAEGHLRAGQCRTMQWRAATCVASDEGVRRDVAAPDESREESGSCAVRDRREGGALPKAEDTVVPVTACSGMPPAQRQVVHRCAAIVVLARSVHGCPGDRLRRTDGGPPWGRLALPQAAA